ncbi:MAG TPA: aspartate aminotransferase [Chloroflexi bacterium]|nr:aspartate aminotransferase [Chloroflexota bacterium]
MKSNAESSHLSKRVSRISGLGAIHALNKAKQLEQEGYDIIHLEAGELDHDTPQHIIQSAKRSLYDGKTRYTSTQGTLTLRESVACHIYSSRNVSCSPSDVIITPGVKSGIFFTILAIIDPGDEVIIQDPSFPSYSAITSLAEGKPIMWSQSSASGYNYDIDKLSSLINPKTKLIILNDPANPTGNIMKKSTIESIAELAIKNDLWVLTDEIYSQLYFDGVVPYSILSVPSMKDRTILLDGFSKTYAMTGWRLGYGIYPQRLIEPVCSLMLNNHSCIPEFIQDAGIAALNGPQHFVEQLRTELSNRRMLVCETITKARNLSCHTPSGALYVMIDISKTHSPEAISFTEGLLSSGVSLLPGTMISENCTSQVRLAYTVAKPILSTALQRIESFVN